MTSQRNLPLRIQQRMDCENLSFRGLALALGMEPSAAATLNRIVRGERVSAETRLDIARRMGLERPPRKLIRVVMTDAEHRAWQQCPKTERVRRLTGAAAHRQER